MSNEYKLNKAELIRLKKEEKLYLLYLPMLKLKQEQLQREHNRIKKELKEIQYKKKNYFEELAPYIKFFSDEQSIPIKECIVVDEIRTQDKNISGILVKKFMDVLFKKINIPTFQTPVWFLPALEILQKFLKASIHVRFLEQEELIIKKELKKALQKVNLFETILLPKAHAAIKKIKIALQDEQISSISRSKIALQKRLKIANEQEGFVVWQS